MPRRLSPEKQLELDRLARILGAIAAWMDPRSGLPPEGETFTKVVVREHARRNLPGLQMMFNDLVAMIPAATPAERRELDSQLQDQAGVSLGSLLERQFAQVDRLLQRGKLTSEQQYYLVREHVDFIADDPGRAEDVAKLYALLEAYEVRAARRARS